MNRCKWLSGWIAGNSTVSCQTPAPSQSKLICSLWSTAMIYGYGFMDGFMDISCCCAVDAYQYNAMQRGFLCDSLQHGVMILEMFWIIVRQFPGQNERIKLTPGLWWVKLSTPRSQASQTSLQTEFRVNNLSTVTQTQSVTVTARHHNNRPDTVNFGLVGQRKDLSWATKDTRQSLNIIWYIWSRQSKAKIGQTGTITVLVPYARTVEQRRLT